MGMRELKGAIAACVLIASITIGVYAWNLAGRVKALEMNATFIQRALLEAREFPVLRVNQPAPVPTPQQATEAKPDDKAKPEPETKE